MGCRYKSAWLHVPSTGLLPSFGDAAVLVVQPSGSYLTVAVLHPHRHACHRWRWVWGRPQQQAASSEAPGGPEVPSEGASPAQDDAAGTVSRGGAPALGGPAGPPQRRGDAAVPMERASSSSGPALLATTPVNFPGMHAVRRSHDGSSLQGAVEAQQELEE